jgi:hypothetical protein
MAQQVREFMTSAPVAVAPQTSVVGSARVRTLRVNRSPFPPWTMARRSCDQQADGPRGGGGRPQFSPGGGLPRPDDWSLECVSL